MISGQKDGIVGKTNEIPGLFPVKREIAIINGGAQQRPLSERSDFHRPTSIVPLIATDVGPVIDAAAGHASLLSSQEES